jgi:hypothetical protein
MHIQHPTSNIEHPMNAQIAGIGCSMLDVGCFSGAATGNADVFDLDPYPLGEEH